MKKVLRLLVCGALLGLGIVLSSTPSYAQSAVPAAAMQPEDKSLPEDLKGISIDPQLGNSVSLDTKFVDESGAEVSLGKYFDGQRPVVIVMAYYGCPMLCGVTINAAKEAFEQLEWQLGKQYRVVTISFDPREKAALAKGKKDSVIQEWRGKQPLKSEDDWTFLTGSEEASKKVASELGFGFRWNENSNEYAHAAGIFILSPQGKLSRVLFGIQYLPRDLKLALLEASQGKVGNLADKFLLFCYSYDPKAKKFVLLATRIMKAGGGLTLLLIAMAYFSLWFRRRTDKA